VDNIIYRRFVASGTDMRDHVRALSAEPLRESVDLRERDSQMEDQGYLGSCVAEATTSAYELMVRQEYPDKFTELSVLFVYYNARLFENNLRTNSGANIRSAMKAGKEYGLCRNDLWPYDIAKFDQEPPPAAYADALDRTISEYWRVPDNTTTVDTINQNRPVVIGMAIYSSFLSVNTDNPVVPEPSDTDYFEGGHAMVIVGYDLAQRQFLVKNSFGTGWGMNGYCWIPFEYARQYVFERWAFTIKAQPTIEPPVSAE